MRLCRSAMDEFSSNGWFGSRKDQSFGIICTDSEAPLHQKSLSFLCSSSQPHMNVILNARIPNLDDVVTQPHHHQAETR